MKKNNHKGFTLIELMVVIVILGIIAAYAIPNYGTSITRANQKDAAAQLRAVHAAQNIYRLQNNGNYWLNGTELDEADINTALGLNLVAGDVNYGCEGNGITFCCEGVHANFQIRVNDGLLSASNAPLTGATNPGLASCPGI